MYSVLHELFSHGVNVGVKVVSVIQITESHQLPVEDGRSHDLHMMSCDTGGVSHALDMILDKCHMTCA